MSDADPKLDQDRTLTIAVLSDLHAYEPAAGKEPPSHYCVTDPPTDEGKSPISGINKLILKDALTADLVLCAGDLGHQASAIGIQHAWDSLNAIKTQMKARRLVATTGNHDIDSRYKENKFDPKGFLQSLSPAYPIDNEQLCDRYWARHFAFVSDSFWRLLIVNSSAFHGGGLGGPDEQPEFRHGRISDHTLAMIKHELDNQRPAPPFNFVLCHHHPCPHSELNLGADDLMVGGDLLVQMLGSGQYGEWLIIHGHKHHPKLELAGGSNSAPWVFAAGSLCSSLFLQLQTVARNQFYILSFSTPEFDRYGFVGRFRAWDWYSGVGWTPAENRSGLPQHGGFGWRGSVPQFAKRIVSHIDGLPNKTIDWNALVSALPELEFVDPASLRELMHALAARGVASVPEQGCPPVSLGRPI